MPAAPKPADSIPIDREVPPVGAVKPTDKPAEKPAVVKTDKPTGQPTVKPKPADQAPATKPSEAEAELLKAAENAADAELAAGLRELAAMTRQAEEAEAAAAAGQPTVEPVAVETPQPEQPKPDEKPQTKPPVETTPVKPTEAAGPRVKAQPKPKTEDSKIEAAVPEGTALTPKGIPDDGELELTMTLPEKVDILALIELVGKQLKLNYMFDPTKVRGDVLLKVHDGRIRVKDTYALLETVLKYKGFGMTRRGNLVTIVPLTDAMGQDPVILKEGQTAEPEAGQVVVTGVFSLKHISTQSAENMLKSMQLGTIFNSVSETQTLIVTDYAYRMERIRQLLDLVDVEGKKKRVEERFIRFYKASEMAPKVETMAGHLGTVSVSISAGPSAPTAVGPQPVPGTAPSAAAAAAAAAAAERARMAAAAASRGGSQPATEDTVRLETDDRTNRLFIIGTDEKIEIVNEIIDSLDIPQKSIRTIEEYKIQYIDTEEVVNTLFELGVIKNRPTSPTPTSSATMPRPRTPMPGAAPAAGGGGAASDNEPMISIRQSTNSLLINATDEQHADIALVIAQIDTEQSNKRTVQEYEIQFVDTAEIVQTLEELAIIAPRQQQGSRYGQQSSPYSRTGQQQSSMMNPTMPGGAAGAQPQPVPTTTAALTGEPTTAEDIVAEQPQIAVLESTNSLLVNATPRQHAAIALVIAHVDREPETTSTPYVVYPLENQDPEELAAVLDELVNATIQAEAQKSAPRTGTTGTSPLGTAGTTGPESRIQTSARPTGMGGQRSENEVTIVADKASYSLIVYGNKKNQQWIAQLIKVLDDYRPQVLLDATLVEISKDNEFTMDLNMVGKYPRMRPGGTMTGPTGGGFTGTPYVPPLVTPFPENSIMEGSVVNGSGTAFYADEHIQALLTLMDKKNYGRVLARPSLLVKDNQEGEIKAEKTIYVGEEKSIVTTPAQGDAITSSDIQFKDYKSGITLKITPHIATKEVLQLKIELDRTDFDPSDPGTATIGTKTVPKPLNTVSSNVVTMAVLPDGATIILGGIEAMTQTKGITKVPLLGDIPLIGILFRGVSESDVQSRLYVFVKANIVRPGDELTGDSDVERISRKKRDAFERDENMFQGLDSIPGIKPGKIQPEKILEDDEYIQSLRDRLDQKRKTKDKEPVKVEIKLD